MAQNQVALVAAVGELHVLGEVVDVDLEARQFFDETVQVGPRRQGVEVAEHCLKIVSHGSARCLRNRRRLGTPRVAEQFDRSRMDGPSDHELSTKSISAA